MGDSDSAPLLARAGSPADSGSPPVPDNEDYATPNQVQSTRCWCYYCGNSESRHCEILCKGLLNDVKEADKLVMILLMAAILIPLVAIVVISRISVGGCQKFPLKKPVTLSIVAVTLGITSFAVLLYILFHLLPRKIGFRREFRTRGGRARVVISWLTIITFAFAAVMGHAEAAATYNQCDGNIRLGYQTYDGYTAMTDKAYNVTVVIFVSFTVFMYCWREVFEDADNGWTRVIFLLLGMSTSLLATITFSNELSESNSLLSWYSSCPNETYQMNFTDNTCEMALNNLQSGNSIYFPLTMEYCIVALAKLYYLLPSRAIGEPGGGVQSTDDRSNQAGTDLNTLREEQRTRADTSYDFSAGDTQQAQSNERTNIEQDSTDSGRYMYSVAACFFLVIPIILIYSVYTTRLQEHTGLPTTEPVANASLKAVRSYFEVRIAAHSISIGVLVVVYFELTSLQNMQKTTAKFYKYARVLTAITGLGMVAFSSICVAVDIVCIYDESDSKTCKPDGDLEYFGREVVDYAVTGAQCILQGWILLKMSRIDLIHYRRHKEACPCQFLPGLALYLGIANMMDWGVGSFVEVKLSQEDVLFASQIAVVGKSTWRFITQLLYPFAIFFRFHSAAVFFEAFWTIVLKSKDNPRNSRPSIPKRRRNSI